MSSRLKFWLLAVAVLSLAAFLLVFQPITRGYRQDRFTHRPIPPAATMGPLKLYQPVPQLNLGLDLQGGMHVVLQVRKTALYTYQFDKPLYATDQEKAAVEGEIYSLLPSDQLPPKGTDVKRTVTLQDTKVTVRTEIRTDQETKLTAPQIVKQQGDYILAAFQKTLSPRFGPVTQQEGKTEGIPSGALDEVLQILRERVDRYGVAEPALYKEPPDKVVVELPGIRNERQALDLIQKTAVLEFRYIPRQYKPEEREVAGRKQTTFVDANGKEVLTSQVLDQAPLITTGSELNPTSGVDFSSSEGWVVTFSFKRTGAEQFANFTRAHVNDILAIVLDGEVISAPVVREPITSGQGQISGTFSQEEANNLKILLNAGALPVSIEVVGKTTISPTLGRDSLIKSLWAGLVGMILVLAFMVFYYRLPGLLADLALMVYCLLLLGALWALHATLTLPGIAGIVLSIGMAVDANVIIFERMKEELRTEKTLRAAIDAGFNRAWTAILDSNVCSLLTGSVLYFYGTGPIKGFAVTLIIGVAVSLFTAVTVTRMLMSIIAGTRFARKMALFGV